VDRASGSRPKSGGAAPEVPGGLAGPAGLDLGHRDVAGPAAPLERPGFPPKFLWKNLDYNWGIIYLTPYSVSSVGAASRRPGRGHPAPTADN